MPKGPRHLAISFGNTNLTHFGGVYLLHRFLTRFGMKKALASDLRFQQRNNHFSVGESVLAILYPMILGIERLQTTHLLKQNGVFRYLTGLAAYPDPTTLRRFLLRLAPVLLPKLRKLHDRFLFRMTTRDDIPSRLIFDIDSTVLSVCGKHEGARAGDNPMKRCRPSYHPLLCFEVLTKDFWHGELRAGDAHTSTGVTDLLTACFSKVPEGVRAVLIRADKGFYDHEFVEWVEAHHAQFILVAKLYAPIKRKLGHLRYSSPSRGVEVAEFRYQPRRWPAPYRFVVIRPPQAEETTEQLTLFKLGKYHYQVLVTNLPLQPLNLWRLYNDRAGIELISRQLKGDYPLGKIPTHHFSANEAYFHLLLFSYNLINWFKRLCLPPEFQNATLQTLRHQIFLMPAQLSKTDNRPRLNLTASGDREDAWKFALHKIQTLRL